MSHAWTSTGENRTIWWYYEPSDRILTYLKDMRDAVRFGVFKAEELRRIHGKMPSPIDLRREIKARFDSSYDYAKHHINPVCRSSIAILRSFRKNGKGKKFPEVGKLSMRLDSELVKLQDGYIRITVRPHEYEYIPVNSKNRKFSEYCQNRISEVLITDRLVVLSFKNEAEKAVAEKKIGIDVNFSNITGTVINHGKVEEVLEKSTSGIVKIQNDFSRRRSKVQKHIRNPHKRYRILKQTRGRQRNRVKDAMHKLSTDLVKEFPDATFIVEDLKHIRKTAKTESKKLRTYLNRWPYAEFLRMIEYKSPNKTIKVNPGGTSSECPVCGGKVKHPAWKISRCENCGLDYDRDRLASLAISLRGLDLCGDPFPVSAESSLSSVKDEYLYVRSKPEAFEAGSTEMVYDPNMPVYKVT